MREHILIACDASAAFMLLFGGMLYRRTMPGVYRARRLLVTRW